MAGDSQRQEYGASSVGSATGDGRRRLGLDTEIDTEIDTVFLSVSDLSLIEATESFFFLFRPTDSSLVETSKAKLGQIVSEKPAGDSGLPIRSQEIYRLNKAGT